MGSLLAVSHRSEPTLAPVVVVAFLGAVFFAPTLIALLRGLPAGTVAGVLVVNAVVGLSVFGWFVALGMAMQRRATTQPMVMHHYHPVPYYPASSPAPRTVIDARAVERG